MSIRIRWDLYKPTSGKWGYGGVVEISGENKLWDTALLDEIDSLQGEIQKGIIPRRKWILVIGETEAQYVDPDYSGFYTQLFTPQIPWE